ncbi:hypothetical protein O7598_23710 [Micromonospora sp. WMMC241]|uniref:hypothetical protein n=1 Tax=Micromonospora sp. WMMC241 TaxID=3015159 RepID=UPI0022B626CB|nr:hypothetical protein [Micromonospora sp. WMMC241]MCZ7439430.1 hypothetical protein [Micromonospora sp. WMMC241]
MRSGIYRHREHPELLYLFVGLAHHHDSMDEVVVYSPLFTRPDWSGRSILTYRTVEDFDSTFEWAGDRLP